MSDALGFAPLPLQEAAQAARRRAAGQAAADAFMQVDASAGADLAAAAEQGTPAEDEAAAAERLHAAELARELRAAEAAAAGEAAAEDEAEAEDMQPGNEGAEAPAAVEPVSKVALFALMLPRPTRCMRPHCACEQGSQCTGIKACQHGSGGGMHRHKQFVWHAGRHQEAAGRGGGRAGGQRG